MFTYIYVYVYMNTYINLLWPPYVAVTYIFFSCVYIHKMYSCVYIHKMYTLSCVYIHKMYTLSSWGYWDMAVSCWKPETWVLSQKKKHKCDSCFKKNTEMWVLFKTKTEMWVLFQKKKHVWHLHLKVLNQKYHEFLF